MAKLPTCPICRRPLPDDEAGAQFRPFCCKRCADIDLGRWLNGRYAIPTAESDNPDGDAPSDENEERGPSDPSPRH